MTDAGALRKIFSENDITAVMHFAGYKAVGESVQKPLEYYRNNLDTTLTLLEVMREYGVKNIIFSSSATVYGMDNVSPMNETMKLGECTNPYGWTKWMIERIMTDAAAADTELSVVLLRYFNPIGAHTSGLIGERPTGTPNNLMPYISQVASGRLEKLSIYTAMTTRRRTARECATIYTSWTSQRATSQRSTILYRTRGQKCSTSEQAEASA